MSQGGPSGSEGLLAGLWSCLRAVEEVNVVGDNFELGALRAFARGPLLVAEPTFAGDETALLEVVGARDVEPVQGDDSP